MTNLLALPTGTTLAGDYRIERVLGAGGFGITYLAEEASLARLVTIKEYFPADYAARDGAIDASPRSQDCAGDYRWGLDRFLEEAQTLAKFDHSNIVRVYRYFRANKTGYMVLHFEEGQSFKSWLKSLGRAPRQYELDRIITPLLDALELIHNADFLHRDIAPDNIIIRKDGSPVLIDFGSARGEIAQHSMTISALVKPGYSPYEQYATTSRQQGPWSDIYSLGATLYQAVTGKRPPDAPSRVVADELIPARDAALSAYRPAFLAAIDKALALETTSRPKSVAVWRPDLIEPAGANAPTVPIPRSPAAKGPEGRKVSKARAVETPAQAPAWFKNGLVAFKGLVGAIRVPAANGGAGAKPRAKARAEIEAKPKPEVKPKSERRLVPRPVRSKGARHWRPLAIKLFIGLGVASAAVAMQDHLPKIEGRGGSTVLTQPREASVQIAQISGHAGSVGGVAFAGDGKWLVTTGADATLKIWDASTRALIRTLELDTGPATALAAEGRRAVSGHKEGTVALWDLETGERVAAFKRNEASIWAVTFAGTPDRVAASGHDWAATLYDSRSKLGPVHVFEGHESAVQALAFSPGGSLLASGSADRTVKLWNASTFGLIRTYRGHNDFVTALALAADGRMLASASLDGAIRFWSTSSTRTYRTVRAHKGKVSALAFSPDGQLLASGGEDGAIKIWQYRRRSPIRTLFGHSAEVRSLSFSPNGRRLASAGGDGMVRLWDMGAVRPGS